MITKANIRESINKPENLEQIYRNNPAKFKQQYKKAFAGNEDSMLFRAWRARLEFDQVRTRALSAKDILVMLLLCFLAGTILKIPDWTNADNFDQFAWMISLVPLTAMFLFTMHLRGWNQKITGMGIGACLILGSAVILIPEKWENSYDLACINLFLLAWALYGLARMGNNWHSTEKRMDFLRFSGEFTTHAGLFFLGGGILLLLAYGLLEILNINSSWIIEDLAVYGAASIPLVAAWATDTYSAARKLVPLTARIFSPLLLLLTLGYMGALALNIEELFRDRDTLLTFNLLLVGVLSIATPSSIWRENYAPSKISTAIITAMVIAAVIIDIIGIWAIGWRIFEYGITANRFYVLGSNLTVFGNLAMMGMHYMRYQFQNGTLDDVERGIARYLPVYVYWFGFTVLILPWLFRY